MALRTKSIQYALPLQSSSIAVNTIRPFAPIQVFVPETGSRTFTSCFVNVFIEDAGSSASPTSFRVAAAVTSSGTTAVVDSTGPGAAVTGTSTTSGESQCWMLLRDTTALFNTAMGSVSSSAYFWLSTLVPVNATQYAAAKLTLSYEYDDVANTRIKTVRIPLQSYTGSLPATLLEVGQPNQIPALDSFLPEANKVYRDIFFEIEGNDQCNSTTNTALMYTTDNEAEQSGSGTLVQTLASARYFYTCVKPTASMNKNTTHAWKLRTQATAGGTFDCVSTVLHVTYEYDHAASSKVINSLMIIAADDVGYMGGNIATSGSRFNRDIIINEPGPIQLVQSGIKYYFIESGVLGFMPTCGSQTEKKYVFPARTSTCGCNATLMRIDSSSLQGLGINNFNRGANDLLVNWYRTGSNFGELGSNLSALLYLNYTSSISSQPGGDANHAQTRFDLLLPNTGPKALFITSSWAPYMSSGTQNRYWLMSYGFLIYSWIPSTTNNASGLALTCQIKPNEGAGKGWESLYSGIYESDPELGVMVTVARARDSFKRHNKEPDVNRLYITQSREYRFSTSNLSFVNGYGMYTYHTINYHLSGSVSGYTGGGDGIDIKFFNSLDNIFVLSSSTIATGKFSDIWYDNTIPLYAVAYQDATHLGRSAPFTASGTP